MKLESQVASLDLSKRLHELGVRVESNFYWICERTDTKAYREEQKRKEVMSKEFGDAVYPPSVCLEDYDRNDYEYESFKAFTVAELGLMMPVGSKMIKHLHCENEFVWSFRYQHDTGEKFLEVVECDYSEADCRAEALISLIEKNIITVENINHLRSE